MNENSLKKTAVPASTVVDKASSDMNAYLYDYMQTNGIPVDLMIYAIKDVLLKFTEVKVAKLSGEIVSAQSHRTEIQKEDMEG